MGHERPNQRRFQGQQPRLRTAVLNLSAAGAGYYADPDSPNLKPSRNQKGREEQ